MILQSPSLTEFSVFCFEFIGALNHTVDPDGVSCATGYGDCQRPLGQAERRQAAELATVSTASSPHAY